MNTKNLLKNKWTWIIGGIVLLIIIMISGGEEKSVSETSQPQVSQEQQSQNNLLQSPPEKIETLTDFENSQFCRDFKCNEEDSWQLNSGGVNHSYAKILLSGDKYNYITVEVTTKNKQVTGFGLMYFDRELSRLSPGDLEIAYKLLTSIDSTRNIDSVKNYIIQNVEKEIFQIKQNSPILWGTFNVYAGKIGQQTVSIERVK
jgi:hypothetical protein